MSITWTLGRMVEPALALIMSVCSDRRTEFSIQNRSKVSANWLVVPATQWKAG